MLLQFSFDSGQKSILPLGIDIDWLVITDVKAIDNPLNLNFLFLLSYEFTEQQSLLIAQL